MSQVPFQVMANNQPIENFYMPPSAVKISYSIEFEEESARILYGLSRKDYETLPGTPDWSFGGISKCHVLQFYRMNKLMQAVAEYAQYNKH